MNKTNDYEAFLKRKRFTDPPTGINPKSKLHSSLFPFQRDCVKWGLRRGRAAFFQDCGLGKTRQQLEWAKQVEAETKKPALILAPLAVAEQTRKEGIEIEVECAVIEDQSQVGKRGIHITNYEKIHKFDASKFGSIVLDESSILKAYDGHTRTTIIECFKKTPFKLACTATPSPNDYMELGNHAEFLGVMSRGEMLSTFFCHDGGDTSQWRLKGHAQEDFWEWVCSWAVNIRRPSDLGYDDEGFALPPVSYIEHVVEAKHLVEYGMLFPMPASSLQERRDARRASINERCELSANLARQAKGKAIIWCNLNDEQDSVADLLGDSCVSIQGSTKPEDRISMERSWREGSSQSMVSKAGIFGYGMNWQHCDTVIYCGLSDSYEAFYQTVRRCWRFGQKNPVTVHIVISNIEGAVLANVKRKQVDADRMADEMIRHMADLSSKEIKGMSKTETKYRANKNIMIPEWLKSEVAA